MYIHLTLHIEIFMISLTMSIAKSLYLCAVKMEQV